MFMLAKHITRGCQHHVLILNSILQLDGWRRKSLMDIEPRRMGKMKDKDEKYFSQDKKTIQCSIIFKLAMPDENIDGELWVGRENFQMMGVVKKKIPILEDGGNMFSILYMIYQI